MIDLEVGLFAGRRIEARSLLDAVQGELANVCVAFDSTDQVADGVARDHAGGVYA
ncbi:hypothetical protein D3C80_1861980 [compost metagenome]